MNKEFKLIIAGKSMRCYAEIREAIKTNGGDPFLTVIHRNMTSLVKQILTEMKHRARTRGV